MRNMKSQTVRTLKKEEKGRQEKGRLKYKTTFTPLRVERPPQ